MYIGTRVFFPNLRTFQGTKTIRNNKIQRQASRERAVQTLQDKIQLTKYLAVLGSQVSSQFISLIKQKEAYLHGMFHEGLSVKEPLEQHLPCSHGHLGTEKVPSRLNPGLKLVPAKMSCAIFPQDKQPLQFPFPPKDLCLARLS